MSLDEQQQRAFTALLDALIPSGREGGMPGAGELGIAATIVEDLTTWPENLAGLLAGLEALEEASRSAFGCEFSEVGLRERSDLLEAVAEAQPTFIPGLLFATYAAYYAAPRVRAALGRGDLPPHPGGYELEPFDEALLAPVRTRGPMFRDC